MKKTFKRLSALSVAAIMLVSVTGCGAQFNNIGSTVGNMQNDAQVTYQDGTTFYIHDGDVYKTKDVNKKGEKILSGDISNINIKGEKIYYYDNSISTICKANTSGEKIDRIAELYCDEFVVAKDNIYAMILTGQGSEDLNDPDNYNIVRMKITDRKIANTMPKSVIEKGKLIGCIGDSIYVIKNAENSKAVYKADFDGKNETKLFDLSDDAKVVGDSKGFVVLGTVDKQFGLYSYTPEGKFDKMLSKLKKNKSEDGNALNMDSKYVYYEDYAAKKVSKKKKSKKYKVADNLLRIKRDGTGIEHIMKNKENMDYKIAIGNNGVMVKAKSAGNLDADPIWKGLEVK